jgi:putative DNA primase/helicase
MTDTVTELHRRGAKKPRQDSDSQATSNGAIQLRPGALHEIADEAEVALIAAGAPFYARGGEIVRPIVEDVRAAKGQRTKLVRLRSVSIDALRDHLSRATRFERWNGRTKKYVAADPLPDIAKIILARDGDWRFKPLVGVITTPTMRSDGSILSQPGYDAETNMLLVAPPPMPTIPEQPSRRDALAALDQLKALLTDFPLVGGANGASVSVALSALMTPVVRGAMLVAPIHALSAPEAGTGKSYLVDTVSAIATGQIAPVIAAGRDEAETEKRLAAELMTGQAIVSIDNLNGDLGGDFLCQAAERRILKPRILGLSKNHYIENTFCIFCNGNNIRLVGDVVRRVVLCLMDANMERPELRQFRGDPVATVLTDRGRYIAAILTIVRAYLAAGCPDLLPPLASFADWSRLIRSPLVWLGCADPQETMEAARADDPMRSSLRAVVSAWCEVIGPNVRLTAGDLKNKAVSSLDTDMVLNKAISAVAAVRGRNEIDAVRLGRWLSRNKGRIVDQIKISGEPDPHSKQVMWWLQPL